MNIGDFIMVFPGDGSKPIRMEIIDTDDTRYLLWDGESDWSVAKSNVIGGEVRARQVYLQSTPWEDL